MTGCVWDSCWLDSAEVQSLRTRQEAIALEALKLSYCPPLRESDCEAMLAAALAHWAIGPMAALNVLDDPHLRAAIVTAYHNPYSRKAGVLLYRAEGMDGYSVACAATTRNAIKLIGAGALYIQFSREPGE